MSRKDNIRKNLVFNTIKFVTQLVLQFLLRSVLIYVLGEEYVGLNGLFSNILSFLNLTELGIGTAIVFSMYKPIADGDIEKVKALQNLYKKFYLIITLIVSVVGVGLTPFLNYLIKGGTTVDINIYILYILYLLNTVVGYLSAHKRSLLFAYQRNDIENKVKTVCLIGMTVFQIVVLLVFKNYYLYFAVNILFTIIEAIAIHITCKKMYPEISGKSQQLDKSTKTEIWKNVSALSLHKIGGVVVASTDNILISSMLGLTILGAYSNYYLIITSLTSIYTVISNALVGSVGNLVADSNKEYVYERFKLVNFLLAAFTTFVVVCFIILAQPFMSAWSSLTGNGISLLNFSTVILLGISLYLNRMRTSVHIFRDGTGLYYKYKWVPVVEAGVNLVLSIGLGLVMGINGIIIGTIVSTIVGPLWAEPKTLYKFYFKKSSKDYIKKYVYNTVVCILIGIICYFACYFIPTGGIWLLILRFAVCGLLALTLTILAYCRTSEFKQCFEMLKGFVSKIFKRKSLKTAVVNNVNSIIPKNENTQHEKNISDENSQIQDNTNEDIQKIEITKTNEDAQTTLQNSDNKNQ